MNRKIIMSVGVIVFMVGVVVSATGAFFTDTETSTGNTFTAGDIDLKIDNESYAIDNTIPGYINPIGAFVASPNNSWTLNDLTIEKFFDFVDVKPGDYGEDTISLHVGSNSAWVCADVDITADLDNSITEPEDEVSFPNGDSNDGTPDGDLDSDLRFSFWEDDGDNVLEVNEVPEIFIADKTLREIEQMSPITLADSTAGIVGPGNANSTPIPGGTTFYIAKAWCYGAVTPLPVAQDGLGKLPLSPNGPLVRGTGVECDGAPVGNIGQTDSVVGDVSFSAVQSRNNPNFECNAGVPVVTTLTLEKIVLGEAFPDGDFPLSAGGLTPISGIEGAPGVTLAPVTPGAYSLSEDISLHPGAIQSWSCVGNATPEVDNGDGTGVVTVAPGENVVCTVTNDYTI